MKKAIITFASILVFLCTVNFLPCTESGNFYTESITAFADVFEDEEIDEEIDALDVDSVAMSIGDMEVSAGATIEVPVNLSKNENGISGFRAVIKYKSITPDPLAGIGGYIKKSADDILYNFDSNKVLIVWGSGNGNVDLNEQSENNMFDSSEAYLYKKTSDDFFTISFVIPENAKLGTEYKVSFDGDITVYGENDEPFTIQGESGTIKVVEELKKIEEESQKPNSDTEKPKEAEEKSESSVKCVVIMGIVSVISVLVLAFLILVVIYKKNDTKKSVERLMKAVNLLTEKDDT